jgi:hypothetical protein
MEVLKQFVGKSKALKMDYRGMINLKSKSKDMES